MEATEEQELTLSEEDLIAAKARTRRAMHEQLQGQITAFEAAMPKINAMIATADGNLARLTSMTTIAAELSQGIEASVMSLSGGRTESRRQTFPDVALTLSDLLAAAIAGVTLRRDRLVEKKVQAETKLAELRAGITEFSE